MLPEYEEALRIGFNFVMFTLFASINTTNGRYHITIFIACRCLGVIEFRYEPDVTRGSCRLNNSVTYNLCLSVANIKLREREGEADREK